MKYCGGWPLNESNAAQPQRVLVELRYLKYWRQRASNLGTPVANAPKQKAGHEARLFALGVELSAPPRFAAIHMLTAARPAPSGAAD